MPAITVIQLERCGDIMADMVSYRARKARSANAASASAALEFTGRISKTSRRCWNHDRAVRPRRTPVRCGCIASAGASEGATGGCARGSCIVASTHRGQGCGKQREDTRQASGDAAGRETKGNERGGRHRLRHPSITQNCLAARVELTA